MSLSYLFEPKRVVVTGLDERPPVAGRALAERLAIAGLRGELAFSDLRRGRVGDQPVVTPTEVPPGPVDLVILAGDPRDVVASARTWIARGVGALLVTADPRSDLDTESPEETLRALCREAGVRLVGPRSRGVVAPHHGLTAVADPVAVTAGAAALASNAGGESFVLNLAAASAIGLGIREAVDLGVGADVTLPELLLRWKDDDAVRVIAVDGLASGGPAALVSALRATARTKPVLVHGPDAALLAECGAMPVASRSALVSIASRMALPRRPLAGPRIAVVTDDDALGALALAGLAERGLTPATLGEATLRHIASEVHARAALSPSLVDLLSAATPRHLRVAATAAAADPGVDGVLVAVDPAPADLDIADTDAPVVVDVPALGVETLAGMLHQARAAEGPLEPPAALPSGAHPQLAQAVMVAAHLTRRDHLTPDESRRVLLAYGVPTLPTMAVAAPHAARRAAAGFGYPVTVTLHADGRLRRAVDLPDGEALEAAVIRLYEDAASSDPRLAFEVRPAVVPSGVAIEATAHPRLGHRVTVSRGGATHGALLPLGPEAARALAARATPTFSDGDHRALGDLLTRVARLCTDLPELAHVRLYPIAYHGGRWLAAEAAVALDPDAHAFRRQ